MPRKVGKNDPGVFWAVDVPDKDLEEGGAPETPATLRGPILDSPVRVMKVLERILADPDHPEALDSRLKTYRPDPGGPVRLRWTLASLKEMTTPDILGALAAMGVDLDEARFKEFASSWTSSISLAEQHLAPTRDIPEPFDEDFPWLAATELWRRLLPGRPCVELVEEELAEGYLDLESGAPDGILTHWERAWRLLKEAVPARVDSLSMAEPALTGKRSGTLEDWCDDLMDLLSEEAGYSADAVRRRLSFCTEFLTRFPDSDPKRLFNMRLTAALSHGMVSDDRRMDEAFGALARDFPDNPQVYLGWGDALWWCRLGRGTGADRDRAEGLYERALASPGDYKDEIEERLEMLRQEKEDAV